MNWTKRNVTPYLKEKADKALAEAKRQEKKDDRPFVWAPHPTIPKTQIKKYL